MLFYFWSPQLHAVVRSIRNRLRFGGNADRLGWSVRDGVPDATLRFLSCPHDSHRDIVRLRTTSLQLHPMLSIGRTPRPAERLFRTRPRCGGCFLLCTGHLCTGTVPWFIKIRPSGMLVVVRVRSVFPVLSYHAAPPRSRLLQPPFGRSVRVC